MDIIEKARELGKLIQQEESYIALQKAQADADADMDLQNLIGDFNMKRMSINNEASKKDKDSDKLALLNSQMREDYSKMNRRPDASRQTEPDIRIFFLL